ncbi:MAG: phasin family protein [Pseudomonadota bacterium]
MAQKQPFAFDPKQFADMFKFQEYSKMFDMSAMPTMDLSALAKAQQKNVAAMIDANKVALDGYKAVCEKQTDLFDQALAKVKSDLEALKTDAMNAESAKDGVAKLQAAVEQAFADAKEVAEMAQQANSTAFDILKSRAEDAIAEVQAEVQKHTA